MKRWRCVAMAAVLAGLVQVGVAYEMSTPPLLVPMDGSTGNSDGAAGPMITYQPGDSFAWRPSILTIPNTGAPATRLEGYFVSTAPPAQDLGWAEVFWFEPVNGPVVRQFWEARTFRLLVVRTGQNGNWGMRPLLVEVPGGPPPTTVPGDFRSAAEHAGAPKLEFDKLTVQPMKDRCWKATVSGRVSDLGPPDPNGLKLSYDSGSGGRQTINVAIGADGTFHDSFAICPMGDVENLRPLLMYSRSPGDNVNVGYSGSALRFERRREVLELRESIQLRVKGMGHFRVRVPAAVMGVRW